MRHTLLAAIAFAPAAVATADLISISGGGQILNPAPQNFPMFNQAESDLVRGVNERQGLVLGLDLVVADLEAVIGPVDFSGVGAVDSHLLAFDPPGRNEVADIEIVFSGNILAVITVDEELNDTHAMFGLAGLDYPELRNHYGFENRESFSVSGNVLTFSGRASSPGDYFRVITETSVFIPAPSAAGVLALGGLAMARRRR